MRGNAAALHVRPGSYRRAPAVVLEFHGAMSCTVSAAFSRTFRTNEKPLECTPEEGSATRTSPTAMESPDTTLAFSTDPTQNPAQAPHVVLQHSFFKITSSAEDAKRCWRPMGVPRTSTCACSSKPCVHAARCVFMLQNHEGMCYIISSTSLVEWAVLQGCSHVWRPSSAIIISNRLMTACGLQQEKCSTTCQAYTTFRNI